MSHSYRSPHTGKTSPINTINSPNRRLNSSQLSNGTSEYSRQKSPSRLSSTQYQDVSKMETSWDNRVNPRPNLLTPKKERDIQSIYVSPPRVRSKTPVPIEYHNDENTLDLKTRIAELERRNQFMLEVFDKEKTSLHNKCREEEKAKNEMEEKYLELQEAKAIVDDDFVDLHKKNESLQRVLRENFANYERSVSSLKSEIVEKQNLIEKLQREKQSAEEIKQAESMQRHKLSVELHDVRIALEQERGKGDRVREELLQGIDGVMGKEIRILEGKNCMLEKEVLDLRKKLENHQVNVDYEVKKVESLWQKKIQVVEQDSAERLKSKENEFNEKLKSIEREYKDKTGENDEKTRKRYEEVVLARAKTLQEMSSLRTKLEKKKSKCKTYKTQLRASLNSKTKLKISSILISLVFISLVIACILSALGYASLDDVTDFTHHFFNEHYNNYFSQTPRPT